MQHCLLMHLVTHIELEKRMKRFRLSEVLCAVYHRSCSCPCFTLLPHVCLTPLRSADLAVADSPLFARCRPASRCGRSLVGGPVPSTPDTVRVFIFLLCTNRCNNNNEFSVNLKIDSILFVSADPQFLGAINIFGWSPARSRCLASIRST